MRVGAVVALMSLIAIMACGPEKHEVSAIKEKGMVGTSCHSRPKVNDSLGINVCIIPEGNWPGLERGEFWFSILTPAAVAKSATIKACENANALDYGVKYGKSCYKSCQEKSVTHCLPVTPNPDI